jgi:RNA polymerase sigma factor (sigma-70 family)
VQETEDSIAIRRCQQGDVEALGILVARHQAGALRLAFLLTGDQMLAEDIVQDGFLAAYQALPRFQLARPFVPWFYRIVTNTARMRQRTQVRHPAVSLDAAWDHDAQWEPTMEGTVGPEALAERDEVRRAVGALLAALTTAQREALALRYYYGFSDQEIAEIVGCRAPAARQRLYGGLHALKKLIRQRAPWLIDETTAYSTEATDAT